MTDSQINDDQQSRMERVHFVVDDTPHACWDWELQKKNLEFLRGIDPHYFEYVVSSNMEHLERDQKHYAALNLRIAYSQSLETLFALLMSLVQAPHCSLGWMLSYRDQLPALVSKINNGEPVLTRFQVKSVTWQSLSQFAHRHLKKDDEAKKAWVVKGFGDCWSRFASDFTKHELTNEYHSIKHGLRTSLGGFTMAAGAETTPGEPVNPEAMQSLGGSDFGTSFFLRERIGNDKINFRPKPHDRNWLPDCLANAVILTSMSITNVISCLRILNGDDPTNCQFKNPVEERAFWEPWSKSTGVTDSSFDRSLGPEHITPCSKEEILRSYEG